jgi:hypothetical protein
MDDQAPNYHAEFLKSPHHATLAVLTLGLGFLSAELVPLIIGATIYVLGWIYLPDMPFFKRWVDKRSDSAKRAGEAQKVADFLRRRDTLLNSLAYETRMRYSNLAQVCKDIETASADSLLASGDAATDPRLRKLDELMWTYLRLLGIQQSLQQFLATERQEDVPTLEKDADAECKKLTTEVEALKDKGDTGTFETKQRYLNSRLERLDVLHKRAQRSEQAESNLQLVISEQERLEQQIKLIRADAIATKNTSTLTARIDATVEHLDQTNKWLSEMDEFKDLVGDMPSTDERVGYEAARSGSTPPPIIEPIQPGKRSATRQRQQ